MLWRDIKKYSSVTQGRRLRGKKNDPVRGTALCNIVGEREDLVLFAESCLPGLKLNQRMQVNGAGWETETADGSRRPQ